MQEIDIMEQQYGPEHLHAPWRMEYIEQAGKPHEDCIFCWKPREKNDPENFIIFRGVHNFVILNAFPYNNGHLMVVPYQHTADLSELSTEATVEMMQLANVAIRALRCVMSPDGFNLGMNIGRAAGAGIAEHLHLHIVPRWNGDTNFMPVFGNVRVLPESLERTWEKISAAFKDVCEADAHCEPE